MEIIGSFSFECCFVAGRGAEREMESLSPLDNARRFERWKNVINFNDKFHEKKENHKTRILRRNSESKQTEKMFLTYQQTKTKKNAIKFCCSSVRVTEPQQRAENTCRGEKTKKIM